MKDFMLRTDKQNRAVHKFFEEAANELNASGITMRALVEHLEIEHTKESVKSIFRAIASAKFGKESTAELTTIEMQETFEEFARLLAQNGIVMSFPSYQETEEYLNSFHA